MIVQIVKSHHYLLYLPKKRNNIIKFIFYFFSLISNFATQLGNNHPKYEKIILNISKIIDSIIIGIYVRKITPIIVAMTKKIVLINKKRPFHMILRLSDLKHSLINNSIVINIVIIANRLNKFTISVD